MSANNTERTMMLLSIVARNKGKKLMETLDKNNIRLHLQTVGFGTAPSEMMDIWGLTENGKDIVLSFGTETNIKNLMHDFGEHFESHSEYGGLTMVLQISAINRLTAELLSRSGGDVILKGENEKMSNKHKHSLIMITVAQGYTDEVMQAAKAVGATGGTVIRGRLAETEALKELADIDIEEEREILLILAPSETAKNIMEAVNGKFGLFSEARGILCAVPVDKAYKI